MTDATALRKAREVWGKDAYVYKSPISDVRAWREGAFFHPTFALCSVGNSIFDPEQVYGEGPSWEAAFIDAGVI